MSKFSESEKPEKSKNHIKEQKRQSENEDFTKKAQIHQNKKFSYKQLEVCFVFYFTNKKSSCKSRKRKKLS